MKNIYYTEGEFPNDILKDGKRIDIKEILSTLNNLSKLEANNYFLKQQEFYHSLGYDVFLTSVFGKDGIKMVKRYSFVIEKEVECVQIWNHDKLADWNCIHDILGFLYKNIEKQEFDFKEEKYGTIKSTKGNT